MATRRTRRLVLSCLYLGLLFLGAGAAFYYLQYFSGTIFLLPGTPESLIFAPADGSIRPGASQRKVAPDLLLLDNPDSARALRPEQSYDGLVLPFSLRLDAVEVIREHEARNLLYVESPSGARVETIAPGAHVAVSAGALQVTSIGPWEGLIRDARGRPMAMLEWSTAGNPQKNRAFLEAERSYVLQSDLAACFRWHPGESEATAAAVDTLEAVPGARWGVRDGKAVQWFENFIPGTGAVLQDGTRISLVASARSEGWIELQVVRGAGATRVRVAANANEESESWRYEDPAGTGRVLMLDAWREDAVLGRLLTREATVQTSSLATGIPWELPGGLQVTVTQLMGQAVAVPGDQIRAAYVQLGDQVMALREGLAEKIGDDRVRYQVEAVPPDAQYRVSVLDAQGAVQEEHTLGTGASARIGAWVISLSDENPFAPHGVALNVVRRPGGAAQTMGLMLFVVASLGLVVARFFRDA